MSSLLLISPDTETQELLKLRCELAGFDVFLGFSANEVTALLGSVMPDIIIVDLLSYDAAEKEEALRIFHEIIPENTLRVLIAPRSTHHLDDVKDWPVDLILRKPLELESVTHRITELLSKRHGIDDSI